MNYVIRDVNALEQSATTLSGINQKVSENAQSITSILNAIEANWQNEMGTDKQTAVQELKKCVNKIESAICPTVTKYVDTMNTLVAETRRIQSQSASTSI